MHIGQVRDSDDQQGSLCAERVGIRQLIRRPQSRSLRSNERWLRVASRTRVVQAQHEIGDVHLDLLTDGSQRRRTAADPQRESLPRQRNIVGHVTQLIADFGWRWNCEVDVPAINPGMHIGRCNSSA